MWVILFIIALGILIVSLPGYARFVSNPQFNLVDASPTYIKFIQSASALASIGTASLSIALAAILFRHLRYFTYPVPSLVLYMETVALFFGYLFGLTILYLFWRRLALPRSLYISNVPDYFALILLGGIAASGILVSYWLHVNIVDVKAYILGLMTLRPVSPPAHPLFLVHLTLVLILMIYFPFSKLLHAGGVFFSPARNQPYKIQNPGHRYVNPWDQSVGD